MEYLIFSELGIILYLIVNNPLCDNLNNDVEINKLYNKFSL